ncbi:Pup--protein ligase [Corynebacterium caspium]|uniref:Pup--protein ligase n=1 Tax=Corynebacterium caspium TaxID=234828 RepID=UPI000687835F|nr:Pup--protein ligase [Corynebacterium caspium]
MGVETEYGLVMRNTSGATDLSPDEVARYLFQPVIAAHGSSNIFEENGSRLYLDVGSHPEWATVECDSLSQLLAYERAGDRIFNDLAKQAERTLASQDLPASIFLLKNNVDSAGNSYGCHENYLLGRETVLKSFGRQLLPLFITRQLICGSGMIRPAHGDNPAQFVLSQRADQVFEGVSSATTRSRPMINTRDEPHADSRHFRRMHVIVGDSNMAEPSFALKVGSALLVIEMLEAGFDIRPMEMEKPIQEIRNIAADPTGNTLLKLKDGGTISALEVQEELYQAAKRWITERDDSTGGTSNAEMHRVLNLWGRMLTALRTQDFSSVDTEIDWVIKRKLLLKYKERLNCAWDHPKLAQIDLLYHDIRPQRGLFSVLESRGEITRWITDAEIAAAETNPPATTRGFLRGQFIKRARQLGAPYTCDWSQLKVNRPEPTTAELKDPFATSSAEYDKIMTYLADNAPSYSHNLAANTETE